MFSRIALRLTDMFIAQGAIPKDDRDIYQYGFEVGFSQFINILSTLLLGILFRMPMESLVFLTCFMTLRVYTGGLHFESHLMCYVVSVAVTVGILAAGQLLIQADWIYPAIFTGLTGVVALLVLAPVEDHNKPLDSIEHVVFRRRAFRRLGVWGAITIIFFFTPFQNISLILCLSLFAMGITAVCGFVKNRFV